MKNKQVKRMMVSVADFTHGVRGYKTIETHGFHGWDDGVFYCSGSNFMWLYRYTVSLTANQLKGVKCEK